MSIISAGTTTTTALVQTGDTTGSLVLKTGSTPTTAMTIDSSQIVNFANAPTVGGAPLPSGAMSLISTKTASNSASLQFTGLSGYNNYLLVFNKLIPVNNGNALVVVLGEGSGPTWQTSGCYTSWSYQDGSGSLSTGYVAGNSSFGDFTGTANYTVVGNSGAGVSGQYFMYGFLNGNKAQCNGAITCDNSSGNSFMRYSSGGLYNLDTTAKTALKIQFDYSNIASGTASLYGISS